MIHQVLTAPPAAALLAGYAMGMFVGLVCGVLGTIAVWRWIEP